MPISNPPSALVTRVVDILAAAGLKPLIFDAEQDRAALAGARPLPLREAERASSAPRRAARALSLRRSRG